MTLLEDKMAYHSAWSYRGVSAKGWRKLWRGRTRDQRGKRRGRGSSRVGGESHESMLIVQLVDIPCALDVGKDKVDFPISDIRFERRHVDGLFKIATFFNNGKQFVARILPGVSVAIERGSQM